MRRVAARHRRVADAQLGLGAAPDHDVPLRGSGNTDDDSFSTTSRYAIPGTPPDPTVNVSPSSVTMTVYHACQARRQVLPGGERCAPAVA